MPLPGGRRTVDRLTSHAEPQVSRDYAGSSSHHLNRTTRPRKDGRIVATAMRCGLRRRNVGGRMVADHPEPRTRTRAPGKWSKSTGTQGVLLAAALAVFTERGYTDASIAEIVERADSSVGSLYHHFSGKSELYLTLWDTWRSRQVERVAASIEAARAVGEDRGLALFLAGTRSFLEGSWTDREVGSLFFDKDGPPGFEASRRASLQEWLREEDSLLLSTADDAIGRVTIAVLTTVLGEANREVLASDNYRDVEQIIDTAADMIASLAPAPALT